MKSLWLAVLFLIIYAAYSMAAMVTVAWNYPTPTPSYIKGFRVYFGTTSHVDVTNPVDMATAEPYEHRAQEANPDAREIVIPIDTPGLYYFRMTAYGERDGELVDSSFSSEIWATVPGTIIPTGCEMGVPEGLRIKSFTITFESQ